MLRWLCIALMIGVLAGVTLMLGAFTIEQKLGSLIVFGPALAFPGVSFVFATYRASELTKKGV
ncbi:MAG: hypothetical protein ACC628_16625 [Pirellulaceae bacterium]